MPHPVAMELRQISTCEDTKCPTVYLSDRGTAVFVGTALTGVDTGPGELAVELPLNVVRGALEALSGGIE